MNAPLSKNLGLKIYLRQNVSASKSLSAKSAAPNFRRQNIIDKTSSILTYWRDEQKYMKLSNELILAILNVFIYI